MSEKAEAAHVIAKILANRATPLDEVPSLIENVQRALRNLGKQIETEEEPIITIEAVKRPVRRKPKVQAQLEEAPPMPAEPIVEPKTVAPTAPTLIRRADAITVTAVASLPVSLTAPSGTVRGVVQWFDSRTGQGTLRLPGLSHDLPVDAALLASFGITRLFKGQEIEATLVTNSETPRIEKLHLANAPASAAISGGVLRDRHAKTVVVELKRETQRRNVARAEAELLLPPRRAR
jgi:cold shock CspA family protein